MGIVLIVELAKGGVTKVSIQQVPETTSMLKNMSSAVRSRRITCWVWTWVWVFEFEWVCGQEHVVCCVFTPSPMLGVRGWVGRWVGEWVSG
jgi:hypothetical protein